MVTMEIFRRVHGILRPFKEYLRSWKIADGDPIVYDGCVGTCTPFVELLAMSIRGMYLEQIFVPLLEVSKAKKIIEIPDVGMQMCGDPAHLHLKVMVIIGGRAMPNMPLTK